jgi:hypothetical protein
MIAIATLLAASTVGIETGWQPIEADQLEYIIRIEPQLIEAMRRGEPVTSEIPPQLRDVRRYRIVIGGGESGGEALPRIDLPQPPPNELESSPERTTSDEADPGESVNTSEHKTSVVEDQEVQPAGAKLVLPAPSAVEPENEDSGTAVATANELTRSNRQGRVSNSETSVVESKQWWVWSLVLVGLFASLGGNVFLTWMTVDTRTKYRLLLRRQLST